MKKILLLGGSKYIIPVIDAIHKLGYYAITCDYLPDNIAHKYSDEYHNVSIIEREKVLELAQELNIDGIMSFACDPGVVTAAYVAEKMNLPTNPYKSVEILQNKALFRQFLEEHGFNVPKARSYLNVNQAEQDVDFFRWPVIVKPVDSAGSKGVTKIDDKKQLKKAAQTAMDFSISKCFIVEEYIEKKGYSSDSDCFSVNGDLVFVTFCNQRFDPKAVNPYTPSAFSWPSAMPDTIQRTLKEELQRLVNLLKLNTSIYNIETREGTDGKPYIMEVSPRGGGNRLAEMIRYACGVDLITNAVRASVGDRIEGVKSEPVYKGCWAEIILHADSDGVFDKLWIDKSIEQYIIEKDIWVKYGDKVHAFHGANETIGTMVLCFDDADSLERVVDHVDDFVKVCVK